MITQGDDEVFQSFRLHEDEEDDEYDDGSEEEICIDTENEEGECKEITASDELRKRIGAWLLDSNTAERKARQLLQILRNADQNSTIFKFLPKDPRSLYPKIPSISNVEYSNLEEGDFAYLGNCKHTIT